MRYKVGDVVRIVSSPTGYDWAPGMTKWCDRAMTIEVVYSNGYQLEEDKGWFWNDCTISGYANEDIGEFEVATEDELAALIGKMR
jgi:hypothetical protein